MSLDKAAALRRSPLFEMLSAAEIDALAEVCTPASFAPGTVVFEEGEVGNSLYVLDSGEVDVLIGGRPIAHLAAPCSFGEMALVDREQRSATVRARSECEALRLTAESFTAFRRRSRDGFTLVVINIARVLSGRLRDADARLAGRAGSPDRDE
ncbi:MAG TPA: cyclic nucleotide-binding domain-containing protein [Anaeromyxobacteraceae bacterium]|nr:cyclic nucleotide-binding domain-containing protein [Anaeromyxobacteraceae bacterium]